MNARTPALAALLLLTAVVFVAVPAQADAPSNDQRNDADDVGTLPSRMAGTTADSTTGDDEKASPCARLGGSVWYRFDAKSSRRVVVRVRVRGDLDAAVDVYERFRSQQRFMTCDISDTQGRAAVSFPVERGHSYLVRVGRRAGSETGPFRIGLSNVAGPRLPGPLLPATGVGGSLDRVARTAQPWSVWLTAGVRYRVAVVHRGEGCVRASLYRPRTTPASPGGPAAVINCKGYGLFTPRAGQGGRYSVLVRAADEVRGPQRYHLQVARAGRDDSAPGIFVGNYARRAGKLDGRGVDAVDLYRFDVARRSVLFLSLQTARSRRFDLILLDDAGRRVRCACDSTGRQELHKGLRPGRFFVAVRSREGSAGRYRLLRASKMITSTSLRVNGVGSAEVAPGTPAQLTVTTQPAVTGPVTVDIRQFDPLSGWQFVRALHGRAVNGTATLSYTTPSVGRWRASATYDGTQSTAPSETPGFVKWLVASPLSE